MIHFITGAKHLHTNYLGLIHCCSSVKVYNFTCVISINPVIPMQLKLNEFFQTKFNLATKVNVASHRR
jgi:hypothetical protein